MAHFAKLDSNNIVEQVIVVNNDDIKDSTGTETESIGVAFCQKIMGASTNWKQTSYNKNFRGNYAGVGMTYMEGVRTLGVASTDVFIHQQPFPSWSVGINTANWYSPLGDSPETTNAEKADNKYYYWDEAAHQVDNNVGWALTT
tara:strand:- start:127 stop:558 length:432 start_codon:yes stop_codon:yes gene_type:complete